MCWQCAGHHAPLVLRGGVQPLHPQPCSSAGCCRQARWCVRRPEAAATTRSLAMRLTVGPVKGVQCITVICPQLRRWRCTLLAPPRTACLKQGQQLGSASQSQRPTTQAHTSLRPSTGARLLWALSPHGPRKVGDGHIRPCPHTCNEGEIRVATHQSESRSGCVAALPALPTGLAAGWLHGFTGAQPQWISRLWRGGTLDLALPQSHIAPSFKMQALASRTTQRAAVARKGRCPFRGLGWRFAGPTRS